ncbi:MAG: trypsin-like peptidase domain-containing protein [Deferribacteres bacterium]|nr:trypsin-like peptidase domain-containing protein [Deferribacteres bacterium]
MIVKGKAFAGVIVITAILSFTLVFTTASHSAPPTRDSKGFLYMDLDESLRQLNSRVEQAAPGIVMIIAYDITGAESARGNGFFMDRRGTIITNAEIMEDAYSAEVFSQGNHYTDVAILGLDSDKDLALIRVSADNEVPLGIDFDHVIKPGDKVMITGKSTGDEKTVSEGVVKSVNTTSEGLEVFRIKTALPISLLPPARQGPVLDMDGEVVGITTARIIFPEQKRDVFERIPDRSILTAVSMRSVRDFILKPGEAQPLQPAQSKVWSKWLLKQMKTAAIEGFITLYKIGFPKLLLIVFLVIVFISFIQWLYAKTKNLFSSSPARVKHRRR